jgi:long-subunit acyl-CoA synthetase (AMP-forming)
MKITLFTSGSTDEPKLITHENMLTHIERAVSEIGLTKNDRVLDVFPSNVIAHYTVSAQPAIHANSHLITISFDPYNYVKVFNQFRPTYTALIPRQWEILRRTKSWANLDMSCVRYMVTGSSTISQEMIEDFKNKGVGIVANWYGMTEMPPPVFVGYDSPSFDFTAKAGYTVEFDDDGECIINGYRTGDIFDTKSKVFLYRKKTPNGKTWKNSF